MEVNFKKMSLDEIKPYIIKFYIEENLSMEVAAKKLNISRDMFMRRCKSLNIKKSKDQIYSQIKQTNLNRYGVSNISMLDSTKEKIKTNMLNKTGYSNPSKNPEVIKKIQNKRKSKIEQIKLKTKTTWNNKSKQELDNITITRQKTNLDKYGVKHTSQLNEVKSKISLGLHNYHINKHSGDNKDIFNILRNKEALKEAIIKIPYIERNIPNCSNILNTSPSNLCFWLRYHNLYDDITFNKYRSSYELEILNFIKTIYTNNIITNYKFHNKYELDIFIPNKNIGIEFNGMYYHQTRFKGNNYHQDKSLYFKDNNIFILHIYEWEWTDLSMQQKIKDRIKQLLCSNKTVIYARNCEVKIIDASIANEFMDNYHLQNKLNSSINIGLYHNNDLTQVMCFSKARFNNEGIELTRSCILPNYKIIGGSEKLFKYFINKYKPKTVISFCNIDKFTGNVYERLGMKLLNITPPNYWYVNCNTYDIKSRYQCRKDIISKNDTRTEEEIMNSMNYFKLEDAGNYKYVWSNKLI